MRKRESRDPVEETPAPAPAVQPEPAETETPKAEPESADPTAEIPPLPLSRLFGVYQVKPWQQAVYRSYWAALSNTEERPDVFEQRLEEALKAPVGRTTPGQRARQATRIERTETDRLRALRGSRGDA